MRHYIEYLLFQFFKSCVLLLPLKSAQRLGSTLGALTYHLYDSRRNVALENLQYAFPEKSEKERERIAKGAFQNYGIVLAELLWFPNLSDETMRRLVRFDEVDKMKRAYEKGKGVIMLSGHFGNWELVGVACGYLSGLSCNIIVQTQSNKRVDEIINHHRCRFNNKVVPMGMSVREILRTLSEGGVIGLAADQSAAMESAYIEFFGRQVSTHKGPATFALRAGAPLLMNFLIRHHDGTYHIEMQEIQADDIAEYNDANIVELTRRHTAVLEKYIRKYPDHWLWMHRRWKHTLDNVPQEKTVTATVHA